MSDIDPAHHNGNGDRDHDRPQRPRPPRPPHRPPRPPRPDPDIEDQTLDLILEQGRVIARQASLLEAQARLISRLHHRLQEPDEDEHEGDGQGQGPGGGGN